MENRHGAFLHIHPPLSAPHSPVLQNTGWHFISAADDHVDEGLGQVTMPPLGRPTRFITHQSLCRHCSHHLGSSRLALVPPSRSPSPSPSPAPAPAPAPARLFSRTSFRCATAFAFTSSYPAIIKAGYFSSNSLSDQSPLSQQATNAASAPRPVVTPSVSTAATNSHPPHRRRQPTRLAASTTSVATVSLPPPIPPPPSSPPPPPHSSALPRNASDILTSLAASQPADSLRRHVSTFLSLAKPRLTVLVVLTAMAPYALYPVPSFLDPLAATAPSLSPLTLFFLTSGTALCSASANALNMLYEPATDAKMSRTRNRPLVRRLLSARAAAAFALACAATGTAALYWGVNATVAFLGAVNIALYAGVYTPLKRVSCLNTWVGALVGAVPPLMGWAAAAGESATGDGALRELLLAPDGSSAGGWLLAALLFAWQFPHFMALSWTVRGEYRRAGLRMLSWVAPARNARVALRYSLVFVPICLGLCAAGVTEWTFAVTSLPANAWLVRDAWRFWKTGGHGGSARGLFWASVWHLPAVMGLALLQKKGMWQRVWASLVGEAVDEDEWEDVDGGHDEAGAVPVPVPARIPVADRAVRDCGSSM